MNTIDPLKCYFEGWIGIKGLPFNSVKPKISISLAECAEAQSKSTLKRNICHICMRLKSKLQQPVLQGSHRWCIRGLMTNGYLYSESVTTRKNSVLESHTNALQLKQQQLSHRFRQNPLQKNYQEQNPNHGREMATSCHGKKVTWAHNPSLVKQKSILQGTKCNKNSFPNRGTKNWITKRNISYRKAKRPPQDSETGQPTQISDLNRSVRNHFITLVTFTTMTVTNQRHRIPTLVIRIPQNTLWIIRVVTSLS